MKKNNYPVQKTEAEWRAQLSADEYRILREKGTEYAFTGVYNDHFEKGVYCCKGCGQELYDSSNKFDSHCGWPSYDAALPGALEFINDESHGMGVPKLFVRVVEGIRGMCLTTVPPKPENGIV